MDRNGCVLSIVARSYFVLLVVDDDNVDMDVDVDVDALLPTTMLNKADLRAGSRADIVVVFVAVAVAWIAASFELEEEACLRLILMCWVSSNDDAGVSRVLLLLLFVAVATESGVTCSTDIFLLFGCRAPAATAAVDAAVPKRLPMLVVDSCFCSSRRCLFGGRRRRRCCCC